MRSEFLRQKARRAFNFLTQVHRKNRLVAPYLGESVLDLGCGWALIVPFLQTGARYIGVDFRAEIIDHLESQYPQHLFYCLDLENQPLSDLAIHRPFSSIAMLAVIEHLRDPDVVLDQCRALMDESTLLVITTPTSLGDLVVHRFEALLRSPKPRDPHVRIYDEYGLDSLCKAQGLTRKYYSRLLWHRQNQLAIYTKA